MTSGIKRTSKPDDVDRRQKPRIDCDYPAIIRIHESQGEIIEADATLANISASGMYLRSRRFVSKGNQIFILVRLSKTASKNVKLSSAIANIAARGQVVRVEPKPDGGYGIAVQLERHRFI